MNIGEVKNSICQLIELPICLMQATIRIEKQIERKGFLIGLGITATDETNIEFNEQIISF